MDTCPFSIQHPFSEEHLMKLKIKVRAQNIQTSELSKKLLHDSQGVLNLYHRPNVDISKNI